LLDGIATFYHRYGYTDVIDLSVIDIKLPAVLVQPQSPYRVRLEAFFLVQGTQRGYAF
jgi:hypothetical protein